MAPGRELKVGDALTFFYPSTEWDMARGFECACGADECLGEIRGARWLSGEVLGRYWVNEHIKDLVKERDVKKEELVEEGDAMRSSAQ